MSLNKSTKAEAGVTNPITSNAVYTSISNVVITDKTND